MKPFREEAGYKLDTVVLDQRQLEHEPLWEKQSMIVHEATVRLAVEVVSTNWRDDYDFQLNDYEEIGGVLGY